MSDLTVYDLMGEDMQLTATRLSMNQIAIDIINENGDYVFTESTHEFAWDSLVDFARQVLWSNDQMKMIEELGER